MAGLMPPGGSAPDPSAQPGADPTAAPDPSASPGLTNGAPAAPDPDTDPSNPANQTPAGPQAQAINGSDTGGPRAVGTQQDANDAIQQDDPTAPQQVTPEEQAEYDQFKSRFQLILSDQTDPPPGHKGQSMHATIMAELNNPKVPLAVAIGQVTAHLAMMIVQTANAQKVTYQPDVLLHVSQECVALTYLAGLSAGIFKGVPPFKGLEPDGSYDFSQQEVRIIADSQMQAMRTFGNMEIKMGMISPEIQKSNMDFWHQQVAREVKTGKVNEQVLQTIAKSGAMDHIQSGLSGMTGGGGSPNGATDPSQAAPTPDATAAGAPATATPAAPPPTDPNASPPDAGPGTSPPMPGAS